MTDKETTNFDEGEASPANPQEIPDANSNEDEEAQDKSPDDKDTNNLVVGEVSPTNPQKNPVANANTNEDKEARDKPPCEKGWLFADVVSAALKVCTGIMFIIGARFLYRYAKDAGIEYDPEMEKDTIDNRTGAAFVAGVSLFFIATIFDLVKDSRLGTKHLIAHILAICGIFFWWVGSLIFFPDVNVEKHYNADSTMWITGAVLLIIAQVTMFISQNVRDPRGNFAKFASLSFALLGSILILSGATLRNSALDLDDTVLDEVFGNLDGEPKMLVENLLKNVLRNLIKGAECYIAGAVFYLVYGILDGLALVLG